MSEKINHPAHYGGETPYEAIKVIEAWGLGFCLGNTVKYISRAGRKGDALEDLKKALWYLEREIQTMEGKGINSVLLCSNCGVPYGRDTHRCPEGKYVESLQVAAPIEGSDSPTQPDVQLPEVPEVPQSGSSEEVFHEVGARSQVWLDRLGQHDRIAEEILE